MESKILVGNTKNVRFFLVDSTNITKKMLEQNNLPDHFAYNVSKLLSIFYIISKNIKIHGTEIYLKVDADGFFGNLKLKTTSENSSIMQVIIDEEKMKKLESITDIDEFKKYFSIGNGNFSISMDYNLKNKYKSNIKIENGDIDKAIYDYYKISEQVESIIRTSTSFDGETFLNSGAILIQAMPKCDETILEKLNNKLNKLYDISYLLNKGFSLEKIVSLIFEDDDKMFENNKENILIEEYRINEVSDILYNCDCNYNKMLRALKISLSKNEIENMLKEDEKIEMVCNLCGKKYYLSNIDDLDKIF